MFYYLLGLMYQFQYSWRVWTLPVQGRDCRRVIPLQKNCIEFERGSKLPGTSSKWLDDTYGDSVILGSAEKRC